MIKNSCVLRLLLGLWSFIKYVIAIFRESVVYRIVCGIVDFFANSFSKSFIHRLCTARDIENHSPTSVFYRAFSGEVNFFKKISDFLFCNVDRIKGNGVFAKALHKVSKGSVLSAVVSPVWSFCFSFTFAFCAVCSLIFVVPYDHWNNMYALILSVLLFGIMLMASACKRQYVCFEPDKLWLCLIIFMFACVCSTVISGDIGDSIRVLAFFITSFLLCVSVSAMLCSKHALNVFMACMYAVTIFTGLVGVYQRITGVAADASLTDLSMNADMPGRVFSTLGNPNNFAEFLVLFLPFSFVFALNRKNKITRAFLLLLLAVPVLSLLFTYSRSGWIAFAVAIMVFVVLYDRHLVPVCIILGICAVPFLPQSIVNRILTIGNLSDSSSSYRIDIWAGCVDMLKKWWYTGLGLGPGGFAKVYPNYAYGASRVAPHSHMQFMEILIESGLVGFLSYVWMTFELIKRSCVNSKIKDKELRCIAIAGASSMTGLILIGLFEYCWFYPRVMFAFFVCAGIVMAVHKLSKKEAAE